MGTWSVLAQGVHASLGSKVLPLPRACCRETGAPDVSNDVLLAKARASALDAQLRLSIYRAC